MVRRVVDILEDKKGSDIVVLDIRAVSLLADYFVICTAETIRQAEAMMDAVVPEMKGQGRRALGLEGEADSGWVLLDYGDIVIHIFSPQQRDFYALDRLWKDAKTVVRIQ